MGSLLLKLTDTHVSGLSVDASLSHWALTSTSADTGSVDDVTLLGFVSETAGLVRSTRARALVGDGKLSELPGSDSENESHNVSLLLSPKFFEILVGSHLRSI